ncbi:MAG: hypothetical protein K2F81_05955 [Ruminococcus sp.]|nr:hypothetical protein [Ruminococcus sp.]
MYEIILYFVYYIEDTMKRKIKYVLTITSLFIILLIIILTFIPTNYDSFLYPADFTKKIHSETSIMLDKYLNSTRIIDKDNNVINYSAPNGDILSNAFSYQIEEKFDDNNISFDKRKIHVSLFIEYEDELYKLKFTGNKKCIFIYEWSFDSIEKY